MRSFAEGSVRSVAALARADRGPVPTRELRAPQIELAMGDRVTVLVLRHLEPLTDADRQRLRDFGQQHGVQWRLQPKGPDSVAADPDAEPPSYALPEFGIVMPFRPTDFTQVNPQINRVMARALRLLGAGVPTG